MFSLECSWPLKMLMPDVILKKLSMLHLHKQPSNWDPLPPPGLLAAKWAAITNATAWTFTESWEKEWVSQMSTEQDLEGVRILLPCLQDLNYVTFLKIIAFVAVVYVISIFEQKWKLLWMFYKWIKINIPINFLFTFIHLGNEGCQSLSMYTSRLHFIYLLNNCL